ncbi:acyl-CoA synthetase [Methylopila jiangsuensis]|uniref:Acyl-CoA synthetase n=1 Tax=Methylopila jiangsuensis TaxID=586230 RepID=A0A9W6JJ62_9HYPH|nr:fatty acyl-AMP ligase [Methylopila jiangsuensis]MDR6286619.1 fatty-acyl-CoA synthase [Methylopila jiangsuensis]GLK77039.1 acyl-CoA synthetase [Methylopila jiangsuensis]
MTDPYVSARPAAPATILDALDRAADGDRGFDFHSARGALLESLPYARLRDDARALARRLLAAGLAPGDRVALIAETEADFVRLFFACGYARLIPAPMPLPMAFGGREAYLAHIRRMIERADAAAAFAPAPLKAWLEEAAAGLPLRFVGALADLPEDAAEGDLPRPAPEDLAYLQFSSGSTQFPKGIMVTHAALMANAEAISRHGLKTTPADRCVSWLPFYHDMGLVGFLLTPVVAGLSVDYLATRDFARRPLMWLELIARNRATISYSPSFGFELCAQRAATLDLKDLDLSSWRTAGIGGDMIRPHILRRFVERFAPHGFDAGALTPSYGMAEATLALSFAPLGEGLRTETLDLDALENEGAARPAGDEARAREFVLCGPALPGHAIEARDAAGAVVPAGAVGRIFARGPSLMTAYFRDPDATAEAVADGWLDTGDLGYVADGQIVITGRAKDLILVNGRNLWPQDLEWAAEREIPGLRSGDVAAFSVDGAEGEEVAALVQCRSSDPETRSKLADDVAGLLRQRFGVPVVVRLVGAHALPVTSSGKLSRSRARELYRAMAAQA